MQVLKVTKQYKSHPIFVQGPCSDKKKQKIKELISFVPPQIRLNSSQSVKGAPGQPEFPGQTQPSDVRRVHNNRIIYHSIRTETHTPCSHKRSTCVFSVDAMLLGFWKHSPNDWFEGLLFFIFPHQPKVNPGATRLGLGFYVIKNIKYSSLLFSVFWIRINLRNCFEFLIWSLRVNQTKPASVPSGHGSKDKSSRKIPVLATFVCFPSTFPPCGWFVIAFVVWSNSRPEKGKKPWV